MARGRKPIPTALKIAAGNPGRRPLNMLEPQFGALPLEPPEGLDGAAAATWRRLAKVFLQTPGVATVADSEAVRLFCEAASEFDHANREIEKSGRVIEGSRGTPIISPWVRIKNAAADRMTKLASKLAMTPCDRASLKIPPPQEPTPSAKSRFFPPFDNEAL